MKQFEEVIAVSLLVFAAAVSAQTLPDFSGRWASAPAATASGVRGVSIDAATMGSGWGAELTIEQRGGRLTVDRLLFSVYDMQPPLRFVYALDGSETRTVVNMGRGPQEFVSRAAWEGATLAITTTYESRDLVSGKAASHRMRHVLALNPSGSLVVTTTHEGGDGSSSTTYERR